MERIKQHLPGQALGLSEHGFGLGRHAPRTQCAGIDVKVSIPVVLRELRLPQALFSV